MCRWIYIKYICLSQEIRIFLSSISDDILNAILDSLKDNTGHLKLVTTKDILERIFISKRGQEFKELMIIVLLKFINENFNFFYTVMDKFVSVFLFKYEKLDMDLLIATNEDSLELAKIEFDVFFTKSCIRTINNIN